MSTESRDIYHEDDELLLGEAAALVKVHSATLRRWADAGKVPVLRTPTNQRRFRVGDLRRLIVPEQRGSGDEDQAADEAVDETDRAPARIAS